MIHLNLCTFYKLFFLKNNHETLCIGAKYKEKAYYVFLVYTLEMTKTVNKQPFNNILPIVDEEFVMPSVVEITLLTRCT